MKLQLLFYKILFLKVAGCLISVQLYAQSSKLIGHIKGLGNRPVVFGYLQKGSYKLDTVLANNDQSSYKPKRSDDGQIHLRISRSRYTSFWYEPGTLTVSDSIDKPYKLIFIGGPENTVLNQYRETIEWPYEEKKQSVSDSIKILLVEQERKDILSFIQDHPSARTSAHLLCWQTISNESLVDTYERLLKMLSSEVQATYQGKETARRLVVLRNQPVVGKTAPAFTLADTAGHTVSLAAYRGKYILLDFWGHWCSPCIKSFPRLKQLQQTYGERLVIIGIAAEYATDKPQWIRAIKTNDLNWLQVSELASDKGEVNTQYNITAFPIYLLLDKEGIVLERTLSIEQIEQKLTSLGNF
ncbi:TlpA family protein disulfide reductase [Spirosoma soli]|uniref:TlpA family protein disulfide reductase n=1 Tax=Spirosoma soli TaxID=1770529 RepID=A0ABW5LZI0_9BACT